MDFIIKEKISKFCASKERCSSDVLKKLEQLGEVDSYDDYIDYLKNERFLDDYRFVSQYIKSKVELDKWGKNKIFQFLEQKEIPFSIIDDVWEKELNQEQYFVNFKKFAEKKWDSLSKEDDLLKKKAKLFQHLAGKGFEQEFVERVLEDL